MLACSIHHLPVFASSAPVQEYIALRQTYLVRCTEMPGDGRAAADGSTTPLLTPSMGANRSPMKRGLAIAVSPSKRGGGSGGLGGGGGGSGGGGSGSGAGLFKSSSAASLGRAINRLKLPRRNASGAGTSARIPTCAAVTACLPACLAPCSQLTFHQ